MRHTLRSFILVALTAACALATDGCVKGEANSAKPEGKLLARPPAQALALHVKWTKHIEVYSRRVRVDAGNHNDWRMLAESQMALARATGEHSHFSEAEDSLKRALAVMPAANSTAKTNMAGCLIAQHKFEAARKYVKEVAASEPEEKSWDALLGDAALGLGNYDGAEALFNSFARLCPGPAAWTRQGHIAELRGNRKAARELLTQAQVEMGEWEIEAQAWVRVQIGLLDFGEGNLKLARSSFEDAMLWAPDYYIALQFLAQCAVLEGDPNNARALLERAAAVSRVPETLLPLARVEETLGNKAAAELLRHEALQHFKAHIGAGDQSHLRAYALALLEQNVKPTDALELARRDALARDDIDTQAAFALALSANGRNGEALAALKRALRLNTTDASLWLVAQRVYLASGLVESANAALARAHELNPLTAGRERWFLANRR